MTNARSAYATTLPSAFLDSTILVSLFVFWDACQQAQAPLGQFARMDSLYKALKSKGVATDALKETDGESVKRGMGSFRRLVSSANDYIYVSSRVCWSEAHHVLLEAMGLERLVRARVPYGLRRKRPQVLYRTFLEEADHADLERKLDSFRETLKLDHGLDIINVEDPAAGLAVAPRVIWDGAQAIWSRVLMEVLDAYVCSAAIRARADVFMSADAPLREVFKRLRAPGNDWKKTAESLMEVFEVESKPEFPRPLLPAGQLP